MVTVGIDPHKHVHVAVAVDAAGKRIGKPLTVKNEIHGHGRVNAGTTRHPRRVVALFLQSFFPCG